jgi:CBS domain-containing protein
MAAERMHQHCVGALVVVNELQEPVGIITDRDIVERVTVDRLDPDDTCVGNVMTRHPIAIYEGASIDSALKCMRYGPFRRLPVVDRDGRLSGMLCLDDVLRRAAREFTAIGHILDGETARGVAEESLSLHD